MTYPVRFLIGGAILLGLALAISPAAWAQVPGMPAAPAPAASGPPEASGAAILFPITLLLILLSCIGFTFAEGMWSNALRLINVVTAALLATNFWEPTVRFLEESVSASFTFFWDYIALWGLFALFSLIFRMATSKLSQVKVRFLKIADQIGSVAFATLVGWVLVCFTTMSLHTAPLSRYFLFGGFRPEESKLLGLNPDHQWLGFVEHTSNGAFSRAELNAFDPQHQFIPKYAMRRDLVEKHRVDKKAFRVSDSDVGSTVPKH